LSNVGDNDKEYSLQHKGYGKKLLMKAEEIAKSKGFDKIAIIAGTGVRNYYKKFGYNLEDTYMTKLI
jgi:elongator complex protein 3